MAGKSSKYFILIFLALFAFAPTVFGATTPCIWTGVEKIVAIGDIHGDYENFLPLLQGTGLVDQSLHWAGGKTHLVQIGDIMDRGTRAKDVLDLLMRLEKEAEAAGGMVHVLIGNHEELNITGATFDYEGYVTIEQFVSFLPEDFRKKQEEKYVSKLSAEDKARVEIQGLDLASDENLRLFWDKLLQENADAKRAYVRNFNDIYGKWFLQKNAVIKINDIVFCHGGISKEYSSWKLQDINNSLRSELSIFAESAVSLHLLDNSIRPRIVYDSSGPLWYRGMTGTDDAATEEEVTRILDKLKARAMVVGHGFDLAHTQSPTVSLENIVRYNGRIYNINTGINRIYHGLVAVLIIHNGEFGLYSIRKQQQAGEASAQKDQDAASPLKTE